MYNPIFKHLHFFSISGINIKALLTSGINCPTGSNFMSSVYELIVEYFDNTY